MYFKIEKAYLETRSAYIEADSIEEAKRMFNEGEYELEEDDNYGCVSSILFKTGKDADLSEIDDLSFACEIEEWDAISGKSAIKWESEEYNTDSNK